MFVNGRNWMSSNLEKTVRVFNKIFNEPISPHSKRVILEEYNVLGSEGALWESKFKGKFYNDFLTMNFKVKMISMGMSNRSKSVAIRESDKRSSL